MLSENDMLFEGLEVGFVDVSRNRAIFDLGSQK